MVKAETAAASLKKEGEKISDWLQIAIIMKGLSQEFKMFSCCNRSEEDT